MILCGFHMILYGLHLILSDSYIILYDFMCCYKVFIWFYMVSFDFIWFSCDFMWFLYTFISCLYGSIIIITSMYLKTVVKTKRLCFNKIQAILLRTLLFRFFKSLFVRYCWILLTPDIALLRLCAEASWKQHSCTRGIALSEQNWNTKTNKATVRSTLC